jgi:Copper chaperone PCu(A)C
MSARTPASDPRRFACCRNRLDGWDFPRVRSIRGFTTGNRHRCLVACNVAARRNSRCPHDALSAGGDRLVSVSTPVAQRAEWHRTTREGVLTRMRRVAGGLALPAGKPILLSPQG